MVVDQEGSGDLRRHRRNLPVQWASHRSQHRRSRHPRRGPGRLPAGRCTQFNQAQLQDSVSISFNTIDLYGLDNWRVNKRLTLNLGLRWEGLPHSYDNNNRLSNFYPNLYNPADAAQFTSPTSGALNTNGPGFSTVPGIKLSTVPFYLNGVGLAGGTEFPGGWCRTTT